MKKLLFIFLTVSLTGCSEDKEIVEGGLSIKSSGWEIVENCGPDCVKVQIKATLHNNTEETEKGRLIFISYNGDNPNTIIFSEVFTVPKRQDFNYSEFIEDPIKLSAFNSGLDEVIFERESLIQN